MQGKTSRWALAWSFTADANAASQPLPRFPNPSASSGAAQAQQRQQPGGSAAAAAGTRPLGRKRSWQVQAPARAGGAVLAAVRRCMQQAGLQCGDAGPYSLCCRYQPTAEQLSDAAAAADAEPAAKRVRLGAGGGAGGGGAQPQQEQEQPQQWQIDLQLFQQHAGLFLLTAALQRSAPDAALPWFGGVAQQLQRALAAQWSVHT